LGLDVIFINLDFEKAYDIMEWPFIDAMLKVLGFIQCFGLTMGTLFLKASTLYPLSKINMRKLGSSNRLGKDSPLPHIGM